MANASEVAAQNKDLVRRFYDGAVRGDMTGFREFLHPDFLCHAPDYLPWGGPHRSAKYYFDVILPQVARVLDFSRFSYESLMAEEAKVVALIHVGVTASDAMIMISEHWVIAEQKALSIWVAYFEPRALLEQIQENARMDGAI